MGGQFLAALCAAVFCLAGGPLHASTSVDVATAKRLSLIMMAQGQPQAAHDILTELHRHNRDDPEILITLSRAERALGHNDEAIDLARTAFRVSDTPTLRFLSARVMAEALASDDQHTKAQIWLRRAGHHAPTPAAENLIYRDYNYVRSRNPWAFRFAGSVTPSDNVNDAPTTDEILIGGLVFVDPTQRPISGLQFSFSGEATYRLPATQGRHTQVSLRYDGVRVRLGSQAKDINPDVENEDFSSDRVTLGWAGKFRRPESEGVFDASARVFADWNGEEHTQNGIAFAGGYSFRLLDRNRLRFGAEVEDLTRLDRSIRSSTTYRLSGSWTRQLENKDLLGVALTLSETDSESSAVAHYSARLRTSYYLSEPIMKAQVGFAAEFRTTLFDTPLFSPERREDQGLTLSASATFSDFGIYGFAPVLELKHERIQSNVSRFDTETTQLSISFRSTY